MSATSCDEQKHAEKTYAHGCFVTTNVMLHAHEVMKLVWLLAVVTLGWILCRGQQKPIVLHILLLVARFSDIVGPCIQREILISLIGQLPVFCREVLLVSILHDPHAAILHILW